MGFIDEVKLYLKAGDGGDGCMSFRREKFLEFGGPDGGNGGNGGNIIFASDINLNTLHNFCYKKFIKANNGKSGANKNRSGISGKNLILKVPIGTQIIDEKNNKIIIDLDKPNMQFQVANGGIGGLGNSNFKSSTNRAPRYFTYGKSGQSRNVLLKLKILSDVGIIGMPNAGKSKFLSRCSNSDTKIGDYPFTTLRPYLGVAIVDDNKIVIVDTPGITCNTNFYSILNLKNNFLKHIERSKILVHLIDVTQENIILMYNNVFRELNFYNNDLLKKEEVVILNKCDLLEKTKVEEKKNCLIRYLNKEVLCLSINDNLDPILRLLSNKLKKS